jgi:hypothetical protein
VREDARFVHDGPPPTFQHILPTGGPTVWCPHLTDLSAVDCFMGTWKLYIVTPYSTELKTTVATPKDASNMFDMPSAASDLNRGYFVQLV